MHGCEDEIIGFYHASTILGATKHASYWQKTGDIWSYDQSTPESHTLYTQHMIQYIFASNKLPVSAACQFFTK